MTLIDEVDGLVNLLNQEIFEFSNELAKLVEDGFSAFELKSNGVDVAVDFLGNRIYSASDDPRITNELTGEYDESLETHLRLTAQTILDKISGLKLV